MRRNTFIDVSRESAADAGTNTLKAADAPAVADHATRFNLLRWISILGLVATACASAGFALVLSHFMKEEMLDHDATLTGQFIASVAETQAREANLGPNVTLGEILDERVNIAGLGIDPDTAREVRSQFFDHLRFLPDVLLADVFAADRKIIWSTNPRLVGRSEQDSEELRSAFASRSDVIVGHVGTGHDPEEREFAHHPMKLYVANYVPLFDARGRAVAVAKIYKEPHSLLRTIDRGNALVWTCTVLGAVFLYLSLFWIVRRADIMLADQQRRLVEAEALCVIGEMSAAVAHGIRNPLATIRSSAELALDADLVAARKNAADIIYQIDRLGKWVRDLLAFSRPLSGENQKIDLVALVEQCLPHFSTQFEKARIAVQFAKPSPALPPVVGERALAGQALANVIANAVEAMPRGGTLNLKMAQAACSGTVRLTVTDTGTGISPADVGLVFKPYYTTKPGGVGLGMALVKRIMERFGGQVALDSRPGEGMRVMLTFRVA